MDKQTADDFLRRVIELSAEMIELASAGDACRTDTGCGIVFGALRDKAYKVRKLAQRELQQHAESHGDHAADDREQPSTTEDTQSP